MKTTCKCLATILLAALLGGCIPALAAVPLRWTVETSRAAQQRIDVYRGETVTVSVDLTSYGQPLALAGSAALYVQTPGMESAWWTVPATVSGSRIEATLAPGDYPADATLLNCFLGGPAINYRAAFTARILGAPGPVPNTVRPPQVTLDFDVLTVLNRPYYTKGEADDGFVGTYGHDMGTGAILGGRSNGYGLGWAGSWYLLREPGDTWTTENELVRRSDLPNLAPYALKSDIPSLAPYALKTDIPSLSPYALKTDILSLASYALKSDIPSLAPYALKSDIPDTSAFLVRTGGRATDLTVTSADDDSPALTVSGFFDSADGVDISTDGGVFFYSGTGGNKAYVAELSATADGSARWDTFGHGEAGRLALLGDAERAGLYSLRTASSYTAASNAVQYVTLPSTASALQISHPPAAVGRVRDWVVYVMAAKDVTVSYAATAHWYSPDAGGAKAVKASTLTAMYFSEIGNNADGKPQFAVSLHELEEVK